MQKALCWIHIAFQVRDTVREYRYYAQNFSHQKKLLQRKLFSPDEAFYCVGMEIAKSLFVLENDH